MSITIPQPAMAWNSAAWNIANYKMTNSWLVSKEVTPQHLMEWSREVFKGFRSAYPSKPPQFYTLVINCHGLGDSGKGGLGLDIGTGITDYTHAAMFSIISEYVETIYINACKAADVKTPGVEGADGNLLCSAIAKSCQAKVYVSRSMQYGPPIMSFGAIDSFEGEVLKYLPNGSCLLVSHL